MKCAGVTAMVVLLAASACQPPPPPPPRPSEARVAAEEARRQRRANARSADSPQATRRDGLKGGKLVFADDFERARLGPRWDVKLPGEWTIIAGELKANHVKAYDERNKGVWLNVPLPEKARVEFDARVLSDKGDMKCEVFASEPKHETGYSVIFGGWDNTINAICRRGEHEKHRAVQVPHQPVQRGKRYRWTMVRTDGVLRWYLDGRFMLAYDDRKPVRGKWFAFNNWLSDVRFDKLKVWSLP